MDYRTALPVPVKMMVQKVNFLLFLDLNIFGLLASVLSMALPFQVVGALSGNVEETFVGSPLDLSTTGPQASLDTLEVLGRKRRSLPGNYFEDLKTQPRALERHFTDPSFTEQGKPEKWAPFSLGQLRSDDEYPSRSEQMTANLVRNRRSEENGTPDVQAKAMETGLAGMEMMQKAVEGGKMAAQAGSDLASGGKAGAEGLASGAGMLSGAADTIAAGAGQVQGMIPG